jgi:hypothetical protein
MSYIARRVDGFLIRVIYSFLYCPSPCSADIEPFLFMTSSKIPSSIIFSRSISRSNLFGETMLQWRLPSKLSNERNRYCNDHLAM